MFGSILRDLRYAARTLLAARPFTLTAVVCLALGIATNTTMFSVFDAMFLRPLPFADSDRLMAITGRHPETGRRVTLSLDDARALASSVQSFESIAAYSRQAATLTDGGEPERVSAALVTANLFPTLRAQPFRGQGIEAANDVPSAAGVAIIGDALWRRRYQADPAVIGRVIRLDGLPYTVIGVMPPKFMFPSTNEIWIPMAPALGLSGSASRGVSLIGRLAPNVTEERANAELVSKTLGPLGSRGPRRGLAAPFGRSAVGSEERVVTSVLMGATTVLLLIACANVANLLLARGAGRRREIAVRASLGATRGRIVQQLLTESVLLALVAGAVALPLTWWGIRWVHDAVPPSDPLGPYYMEWSLDVRTFVYAITIALVTGLTFGLVPAVDAASRQLLNPLREGAGSESGRFQRRVHNALVVAQVSLALVLLAGASLFVRTSVGLRGVPLGYDTSHLMTMRVYFAGAAYDSAAARDRAVDDIAARLDGLPGAYAATVSDLVPLDDQGGSDAPALVEGRAFEKGREPTVQYAGVAGRWPETFDLQIVAGRTFDDRELRSETPVALVNRTLAQTFWPAENPIGRRFRFADDASSPWLSVIGVVPDIRTVKLDENRGTPPTAYLPHRFISTRDYGIVVRTRAQPASVTAGLREAVHGVDPSLALFDVWSMDEVRWLSFWMYIMWGTMFGAFGVIALLIAAVGVYGVVFYTVAQRTKEIGLRVALGARRAQVVKPVLRHVGLLSAVGIAIGLLGTRAATPIVGSLLIGVSPNDPASVAAVSLLLAAVAIAAAWLPAWRASAVDPVVALRDQ